MASKSSRGSQFDRIIEYCKKNKGITNREANAINIGRLSARIWDLRQRGYDIVTDIETHTNEYGEVSRYARYYVHEPEEEGKS